jgi:hypothetical protein
MIEVVSPDAIRELVAYAAAAFRRIEARLDFGEYEPPALPDVEALMVSTPGGVAPAGTGAADVLQPTIGLGDIVQERAGLFEVVEGEILVRNIGPTMIPAYEPTDPHVYLAVRESRTQRFVAGGGSN